MNGPEDHVREAVKRELSEDMARHVLDADWNGSAFGVIGVDEQDRVVVYADDGMVFWKPVVDGELHGHGHPDYESRPGMYDIHGGEGAVMELNTDDWKWIHPRYRWVTDR